MTESKIQLVMVTGMSGAGKTVAIQSFEDLGYFTIDNMPPALLLKFIELMRHSPDNNKLAVVVDMRSRSFSMKFAPFWMNWTTKKTSISRSCSWMPLIVSW